MARPQQVNYSIEDGPTFFADEISITNNESKFYLDFKNASPRIDARTAEGMPIALKHSVIMMDTGLAKIFGRMLTEHVERFEKEHGKIPEPRQAPSTETKTFVTKTDDRPGYFG